MGNIWGGLAAMLVVLPSSVAFGILIFTGLGPEFAGRGAMAGLLGATALGIVAPFIGRTAALISAPCAPAAAVLSALVAELVARKSDGALNAGTILSVMALAAFLAALLQFLYGAIGGGRLIKFIPFQVVTGYLSSVGCIIALGQLPKLFGLPKGVNLFHGLISPELWKWQGLVVGVVTIAMTVLGPRITKKVPAAIFGLLGGILCYFVLGWFFPQLMQLRGNSLVIGEIRADGGFINALTGQVSSLFHINIVTLKMIIVPALTLSVLLSIDTLKTCVGLDALTRTRHNSDRELMGQGIGNLMSFFVGGMPGAGTMGPTLINLNSGGTSWHSGVFAGVFVLLAMLFLGQMIAWVPIGALAGVLLVIAWRMFDKNIFRLLAEPAGRLDFVVIGGVITTALTVDLIAASGVGIAMAILLFIRDQVKGTVIRRKFHFNQISSKTRRPENEREVLNRCGNQGVFCELQGNLFFGTTDQLYTQLESDFKTARFILLDLRRVQSIDYTAVHLVELIHHQLAERKGQLLFSGMPSAARGQRDFEHYFVQMGLVSKDHGVRICETMDEGLEWIENQILLANGVTNEHQERLLELKDFRLFRQFDDKIIESLSTCVKEMSLKQAGKRVFSQGEKGDEMFLIRKGSVRVLLPLGGGKHHHLATIGQGGFFGELAFLDRDMRSADVESREPTELYVLSRARFDERSRADASMGAQVFARLALAIARRLRATDAELREHEDR